MQTLILRNGKQVVLSEDEWEALLAMSVHAARSYRFSEVEDDLYTKLHDLSRSQP